jgi:hypothetical protein
LREVAIGRRNRYPLAPIAGRVARAAADNPGPDGVDFNLPVKRPTT